MTHDEAASWLALGLFCLFLLVVFPLRAARLRARFGAGGRARPARPRPAAWVAADLLVGAGFVLVTAGPALGAIGLVGTWSGGTLAPQAAGIALLTAAIALAIWAQGTMGRAWRTDIAPDADAGLVTGGPFAYVRNPNYVAMLAAAAGALMLAPGAIGLAGGAALLAGLALTARHEEPALQEAFGDAYRAYAARVGRFVPGLGRLRR